METKKCKHCKEEIAKDAKRCPKCGGKLGMPGFVKAIIILVIIFACVIGCVNSCSNAVNEVVEEAKNSYKDINGKTSFKLNESFENKYEKITMVEYKKGYTGEHQKPSDGNMFVLVKFEVENVNTENDELYVSSIDFNGFADGVAVKKVYILDDKYKDLSATISKGKKAIGYLMFEVPKDSKKITIDYDADFWSDGDSIEFVIE